MKTNNSQFSTRSYSFAKQQFYVCRTWQHDYNMVPTWVNSCLHFFCFGSGEPLKPSLFAPNNDFCHDENVFHKLTEWHSSGMAESTFCYHAILRLQFVCQNRPSICWSRPPRMAYAVVGGLVTPWPSVLHTLWYKPDLGTDIYSQNMILRQLSDDMAALTSSMRRL